MKTSLKQHAIELRKRGHTYSEILKEIPVAKSTLSLWLRSVQLSKQIHQQYTEKKRLSGLRGGLARKTERLHRQKEIMDLARAQIGFVSKRELWLIGIMLYWAEGSKEKIWKTGHLVSFTNSDSAMIRVFLKWLTLCVSIPKKKILIELYIHESHKSDLRRHIVFWTDVLGVGYNTLERVYFKKNNPSPKRKNLYQNYHGQLRITVKESTDLNRKIAGWIEGVCLNCPVV